MAKSGYMSFPRCTIFFVLSVDRACEVRARTFVYRNFPKFRTDRSGQTVQTQIKLLLEEQSDQGLHCLQFPLNLLTALL